MDVVISFLSTLMAAGMAVNYPSTLVAVRFTMDVATTYLYSLMSIPCISTLIAITYLSTLKADRFRMDVGTTYLSSLMAFTYLSTLMAITYLSTLMAFTYLSTVMVITYLSTLMVITYLSTLMAVRFRMDAVHDKTSEATQASQRMSLSNHILVTCQILNTDQFEKTK
jgi:hypothetical protein